MRLILALLLATILASAVFAAWPALDLATARLFYDGTTFPIAANRPVEALRVTLWAAEDAGFVACLVLALRRRRVLGLTPRDWLNQTLVFLLGPGLLVTVILKPIWHRARPFQTVEFGGTSPFTRAWQIGADCCGNRSFVSGEAAGAMALAIGLTLILMRNRGRLGSGVYRLGLSITWAVPLVTAWQRMAAGRHFLSDVVLASLLVALLAAVLHRRPRPQALLTS